MRYSETNDTSKYEVVVGEHDQESVDGSEQKFGVVYVNRHPLYNENGYLNDIMMLKVSKIMYRDGDSRNVSSS